MKSKGQGTSRASLRRTCLGSGGCGKLPILTVARGFPMKQVANAAMLTAIGIVIVGAFTVMAGVASQWTPVVVWPMSAVASVIMLVAVGVAIFKSD